MIDFLIIGQGIAGTTLAHQLERKSYSFTIVDDNPPISSSKIASGLWNPVVLKRMKKVWRADEMLDKLDEFYSYVEEKLGSIIIDNKKILRLLNSKEEQNNWFEHSEKPIFENILNPDLI